MRSANGFSFSDFGGRETIFCSLFLENEKEWERGLNLRRQRLASPTAQVLVAQTTQPVQPFSHLLSIYLSDLQGIAGLGRSLGSKKNDFMSHNASFAHDSDARGLLTRIHTQLFVNADSIEAVIVERNRQRRQDGVLPYRIMLPSIISNSIVS